MANTNRLAIAILGTAAVLSLIAVGQPDPPTGTGRPTRPRPIPGVPATPAATVPDPGKPMEPPVAPSIASGTSMFTTPAEALQFGWEIEGVGSSEQIKAAMVSALGESLEVVEYREAGDGRARLRPGIRHGSSFTLAGPLPMPGAMVQWYRNARDGEVDRRAGSLIIKGAGGDEIQRFNFFEGWPRSISIDPVTGSWAVEVVYETMEQG